MSDVYEKTKLWMLRSIEWHKSMGIKNKEYPLSKIIRLHLPSVFNPLRFSSIGFYIHTYLEKKNYIH